MRESILTENPARPSEDVPPERLTIAHLLIFTTTSAILLGVRRALHQEQQDYRLFGEIVSFCYAPIFGAGLAACLLCAWRRANGGPRFPRQPGHWLLVLGGVTGLMSLSFQVLLTLTKAQFSFSPLWSIVAVISCLVELTIYILATRDTRGVWWWVFGVGVFRSLLMLLLSGLMLIGLLSGYSHYWIDAKLYLLISGGVAVAAIADAWQGINRDYLHFIGVCARLAYAALMVAIPWLLDWLQR